MTERQLREQVVAAALRHRGARESDGSHRPLIDTYNAIRPLPRGYRLGYSDPWCAAFVSAVGAELGLTETLLPECSCERMIALYRARGLWREADDALPEPGDLIFYHWQDDGAGDCTGPADHVGLVTAASGSTITTLEGNYSDAVTERRIARGSRGIRGFAVPNYAAAAASSPAPLNEASLTPAPLLEGGGAAAPGGVSSPSPSPLAPPTLRRGDRGETVRAAQLLLAGRGFSCGVWGADGSLGAATEEALRSFQRARGLSADGLCGPATWAALLGMEG